MDEVRIGRGAQDSKSSRFSRSLGTAEGASTVKNLQPNMLATGSQASGSSELEGRAPRLPDVGRSLSRACGPGLLAWVMGADSSKKRQLFALES